MLATLFQHFITQHRLDLQSRETFDACFAALMQTAPPEFDLEDGLERVGQLERLDPVRTEQLIADFIALTDGSGRHVDEAPAALIRAGNLDLTDPADFSAAACCLDRLLPYYAEVKSLDYMVRDREKAVGSVVSDPNVRVWSSPPAARENEFICLCEFNGDGYLVLSCEPGGA
ncbi:MAG: hypothetical protein QNK37_37970 [Acidobacteriota bacterium]|nr:hypothetical protein [Acidobacteriota bacterium]